MNRKLHALLDELNGEGNDLGGGGAAIDVGAAGDAAAGAQGDQVIDANAGGKVEEPKGATTDGMLGAIKEGLAKGGIGGDAAIQTDAEKAAAAAGGKPAAAAPAGQAAGDPKAGAKPQTDEAKAAAEKLAGETLAKKKPDEFKLTDQEKAVLGPKAQARFQELTHYGKVQYDRAERVQQENTTLVTARDNILKTFADAKADPQDLAALLDYNYRMKSGDLEGALKIINNTRTGILKALGREEPGVDLLAEHPDLKARVDNQEISRADALELANNRRANAARQQQDQSQQQQQRQTQQVQQTQQAALGEIQKWCAAKSTADIDYAAREAKIQPQIADIIKTYPPNLWLPTIQRLYESISVTKAPVVNLNPALRPNGAKPGDKAPNSMLDAIRSGLKYPAAAG
jgi:hypothetical protein